jgi:hypothetical protein
MNKNQTALTSETKKFFRESFNRKPRINMVGWGLNELQENGKKCNNFGGLTCYQQP